jgi:hypothetical protein
MLGTVSKRTRGPARTHRRPGTRPPTDRPASARRPVAEPEVSQLESAELIAEDVIENQPAAAAAELDRAARAARRGQRVKPGSVLAARAATEYVYVAEDMRRILVVASLLVAVMIVLWLLIVVFRVIPTGIY